MQRPDSTLNYESLCAFSKLLNKICELPDVPDLRLNTDEFSNPATEASQADSDYNQLFDLEEKISTIFNEGVYEFGFDEWINNMKKLQTAASENPFSCKDNWAELTGKHLDLKDTLEKIQKEFDSLAAIFDLMNGMMEFNCSVNTENLRQFSNICDLIKSNVIIPENYFDKDLTACEALMEGAKKKTEKLREVKASILKSWEDDALTLDFEPILLRYKTEYTNFFKVFKSQYKADKNKFKAYQRPF